MIMGQRRRIAFLLSKMETQKSLIFRWHSLLGGSSDIVTTIFP